MLLPKQGAQFIDVDTAHVLRCSKPSAGSSGGGNAGCRSCCGMALGATLGLAARQDPAHHAVLKSDDIGMAEFLQRACADDAARAACAVDNDRRMAGREILRVQRDVKARHPERARDAALVVLLRSPDIADNNVATLGLPGKKRGGLDARHPMSMLDRFAEVLAWHVRAGRDRAPCRCRSLHTASEHAGVAITEGTQGARCQHRATGVVVDEKNQRVRVPHEIADPVFEQAPRQHRGATNVAALELHRVTHVEKREWLGSLREAHEFRGSDAAFHVRHACAIRAASERAARSLSSSLRIFWLPVSGQVSTNST